VQYTLRSRGLWSSVGAGTHDVSGDRGADAAAPAGSRGACVARVSARCVVARGRMHMGAPGSGAGVGVGVGVGAVAERRGGDMLLDVMMDGWVPPIDPRGFLPAVVLCVCRACGLWPVGVHVMRCSSLRASVEHG
jgi:hypothetical protein